MFNRALELNKPHARTPNAGDEPKAPPSRAAMTRMQRLRRVYDIDLSVAPIAVAPSRCWP